MSEFVSGFVSIVGRPNVGKSTFLNSVLGRKIAIMSDKAQTTRNTIQGVYNDEESQVIFIDTPGMHKPKHELGRMMQNAAVQSLKGIDAVLFMVSAVEKIGTGDLMIIERLKQLKVPVYLIINKIDLLETKHEIDEVIVSYSKEMKFEGVFPISAIENRNIDKLIEGIKKLLPEGPQYYPDGQISDHPERFLIAELIREKVLHFTEEEIPHSVAVVVESLKPLEENPEIVECHATIYVERNSQKGILIGAGGLMLKKIGTQARKDIQNLLATRMHLDLWVKVKKDWRSKKGDLRVLGYAEDNF